MTATSRGVLEAALKLPMEDRAEVAERLLASLDAVNDADADAVRASEVERRARRVLAGDSPGEPWKEVRAELSDQLAKP